MLFHHLMSERAGVGRPPKPGFRSSCPAGGMYSLPSGVGIGKVSSWPANAVGKQSSMPRDVERAIGGPLDQPLAPGMASSTVYQAKFSERPPLREWTDGSQDEDVLEQELEPLPPNVYGWAVSMVIRDLIWLRSGSQLWVQRFARIINSLAIIAGTMTIQVFLLFGVSRLLCHPQLYKIRSTYGEYEHLMYSNHTYITVNGFNRGIAGYRQDERFLQMSGDFASKVCEIPLSHPYYLACVLLVWTFTCQVELRTIYETSYRLFYNTPTVASLDEVLSIGHEAHSNCVEGLTLSLKLFIGLFVQLPRVVTLLALLWLGCKWLTATIGLDEVLLNGLALEFMVLLKDLLYEVCISHRNRFETERLYIKPFRDVNKASCITFFDTQIWGVLSLLFVWGYVFHWQEVLPDYRFDVHDLCVRHLQDVVKPPKLGTWATR